MTDEFAPALGAAQATRLAEQLATPTKYSSLVLSPTCRLGDFDSHAVDCPFVFRHESGFLMTYVGFDGIGYRTGLASSSDLLSWKREGLILDRGPEGSVTRYNAALTWILRDNGLFDEGRLRALKGLYVGTYHAYPRPGYESGPAVIGLCTSKDLRRWEVSEPCLFPQHGSAWETGGLYKSCLVEHDGVYYLFYNAKTDENPWIEQIGIAMSTDLVTWRRHEGNPVLRVGDDGAFDERFVSEPCVLRVGDVWALFYFGLSGDGVARDSVAFSMDLVHWSKSDAILLDIGPEGSIDSRYAHKPSLISHDGRLFHFYCAVAPRKTIPDEHIATAETRGIAVAYS